MKISLKEAAGKLLAASKIAITAHEKPDGDAVGSCLALKLMMEKLGKECLVLIDDDIPAFLSFLPGADKIFKPEQDGYDTDLLVVIDASMDRIGRTAEKCSGKVLNLDHHISNDGKADFLYLDAERAAAAEIIYQLMPELGITPDRDIAANLYTGIATDSGFFKYSSVTPATLRAAAALLETGIRPEKISEAVETKPYNVVSGMAAALQTIELHANGKVAGLFLDYELTKGIESTEGFIDQVRVIEGVDVAVVLKAVEQAVCRVSMRSKKTDVSRIATALGGGGHIRAAGCTIKKPLAEAKKLLLETIEASIEE